jgi:Fic family protein
MELQRLLIRADELREKIKAHRPLSDIELKSINNYFKIGYTYSTNALEGNTLDLTETKILIEDGITIAGKPLKDSIEARDGALAYDFMLEFCKNADAAITEEVILDLHRLIYGGTDAKHAGVYRNVQVYITGTEYKPPKPADIPKQMQGFIKEIEKFKKELHPIEQAAMTHKRLVDIHPFVDGNGRTARILMNIILIQNGYGVASISPMLRREYIAALVESRNPKSPNALPFKELVAQCVIETQKDYYRMLE